MEKEVLKLAVWVPQSGSSRESWHHPCLSDVRGWGRRFSHGAVTSVAAASGGWQGQEQVRPRAVGPQGRMCYLLQNWATLRQSKPLGGGVPQWMAGGWRGGEAESPEPTSCTVCSLQPTTAYAKTVCGESRHITSCDPCRAGVRQTWGRRVSGSRQSLSTYPTWSVFPHHWKNSSNFHKKKFKISLHWFSNMTMLSDAG